MDTTTLIKFIEGRCDAEEIRAIQQWLEDPAHAQELSALLARHWAETSSDAGANVSSADRERLWHSLRSRINLPETLPEPVTTPETPMRRRFLPIWMQVAAAAAIIGIALFFYLPSDARLPDQPSQVIAEAPVTDITPPDQARATLTLADGRRIYLDSTASGILLSDPSLAVTRNDAGAIVYDAAAEASITFHTLSLPRGSRPMRLVLADGSAVWLNAASSITYPTGFRGAERVVSMTGEAYFEVAHDPGHPFIVEQGDLRVRVLGTHFNIRAYGDADRRQVTLLEGSVRVQRGSAQEMLRPGQQAELVPARLTIQSADTESVMAWKNGQFIYDGVDLQTIMQEISRYYDVDVHFRDEIPYQFVARISRDVPVSAFLEKLSLTGLVAFNIRLGRIEVNRP
jgi:ferric-dicitrate binding protein FerR (iron transport regulator)